MNEPFTSTTKSARRLLPSALLIVLALLGVAALVVVAEIAFAKNNLPSPTITTSPANPTNAQAASFSYTHSQAITKFQCSLDGAAFVDCGTTRPSAKAYAGPLSAGSHTFQVRALSGSETSSATSFSWLIDRTPPTVSSINRSDATPTNAGSVRWAVTFSETVNGFDASDLTLVRAGGMTGGSIGAVTPAGPANTYMVNASTGSGDGTLGLNLIDNDSIRDAATNPLGGLGAGNGNSVGPTYTIDKTPPASVPAITSHPESPTRQTSATFQFSSNEAGISGFACKLDGGAYAACASPKSYSVAQGMHSFLVQARDAAGNAGPAASHTWVVDTTAPPRPTITQKPSNPSTSAVATFAWASQPATDVSYYECSKENGTWVICGSPLTYTVQAINNGQHQFAVRAVDAAGNVSGDATYKWKVTQTNGAPFQITGNVTLYMGQTRTITVTLTNPNTVPIYVTSLAVAIPADSTPSGCSSAANIALAQATGIGTSTPFMVPASSSAVLPAGQSPTITLIDRPDVNQDVCKNKSFALTYSGSAHS